MVTAPNVLPSDLPAAFRVADARHAGASESRLRASDLDRSTHGVRVRMDVCPDDPLLRRCVGVAAALRAPFAFSHTTAALLFGLPLPRRHTAEGPLHIAVTGTHPRRAHILTHRVRTLDLRAQRGLPVTSVERTWVDLARVLTEDELVVVGDHLVRRKAPQSTVAALSAAVESAVGRRGTVRARAALARVRPNTESPAETRLRLLIVDAGLPEPIVGHAVAHEGYWVGTPDLAYPQHRIAIEYQGAVHREQARFEEDVFRLERFHDAAWSVLQVTARDLRSPSRFLGRLASLLRRSILA